MRASRTSEHIQLTSLTLIRCVDLAVQTSVWFKFFALGTCTVDIVTSTSDDMQLALWRSDGPICDSPASPAWGNLVEVAANDDTNGFAPAIIGAAVEYGMEYYIQLDINAWKSSNDPTGTLTVKENSCFPPSPPPTPQPTAARPVLKPTLRPSHKPTEVPSTTPSKTGGGCSNKAFTCSGILKQGTMMHTTIFGMCLNQCVAYFSGIFTLFGWHCGTCASRN
jgi:hypothetical protein